MKIKTSELTGAALDWAVATCEGAYAPIVDTDADGTMRINYGGMYPEWSSDWAHGGPIIERERLGLGHVISEGNSYWIAVGYVAEECGPNVLTAAMRCYVASKLGDVVDVPGQLGL